MSDPDGNGAVRHGDGWAASERDRGRQHVPRPGGEAIRGDARTVVRIVLADDHAVVRGALRRVLEANEGFEVVAEAGDVDTALRKVRGHKPHVLVLDVNMPGGSSLGAIPSFLEASPDTAIVVLTMEASPQLARRALRAGALAFVLKEAADTELEAAIRAALAGHPYLDPQLGARVATEPEPTTGAPDGLSDRELEVLRLLALGHTNAEIANDLFLSVRTVESHHSHIQHKIGRTSLADLVAYARERGLFD